ncbi:MAG: tyrosine-protein phosphatase [Xanthomonadales bacterium]
MWESSARFNKALHAAVLAIGVSVLATPAFAIERSADVVIDLEGTTNTRDIGGYLTGDLRAVRTGQIIRSEKLSRLTPEDFRKLEELGVKTVIDLRTEEEVAHAPTVWQGENPPRIFHFPVGDSNNDWFTAGSRLMKKSRFTEAQSLEHMVDGYRMIAEEGPPSYRRLMDLVLDESNWPILIHCSAGKDRTGIATALILEAVGVDRETIMDEYLLTNEIGRSADKAALIAREHRRFLRSGRGASPDAWYPIVGVRPEMLSEFYAAVDERYGSMDAFLAELGVDPEARSALTAALTTERDDVAMAD